MNLNTPVSLPSRIPPITHIGTILLMGSCFAENIGALLTENKFHLDLNPFGILYNPSSISAALRRILFGNVYTAKELFSFHEYWHSPMHHGIFSSATSEETLQGINRRLGHAHETIGRIDWLMLTFGTSWVYEREGQIVANCHKLPEKLFTRRQLTVDEIVADYTSLITALLSCNPGLKILFTVSPIRHIRDGMHANQLSKAVLLLAIDRLQKLFPKVAFYFPSYEIMLDELRDYRFYADDMLHPSPLAVQYLWERFSETFFSAETLKIMEECETIRRGLLHKPFHPESEGYKRFLGQIVLKIERLNGKYPYLDFENEKIMCQAAY